MTRRTKKKGNTPHHARDNLDFELEFYKSLVREAPDYVDALMLLGEAYTRKGLHEEGLKIDKRLISLRPRDPIIHYNLACSYCLLHMKKQALESLEKSIALGYVDLEHLATDPDFECLHNDTTFHKILRQLGEKILTRIKNGDHA